MADKEYTPIEIIDITISNLSNICIPVGFIQQIGIPLVQNINNLKILKTKMEGTDEETTDDTELVEEEKE